MNAGRDLTLTEQNIDMYQKVHISLDSQLYLHQDVLSSKV